MELQPRRGISNGFNVGAVAALLALAAVAGTVGCGKQGSESAKSPGGETAEKVIAKPGEEAEPDPALSQPPAPFDPAKLEPQAEGTASIDTVKHDYDTAAGPYVAAKRGDYVLRNENVALYFRAIERIANEREGGPQKNNPGALIDIRMTDLPVDFLVEYTQGVGTDFNDPVITYDYAEFVKGVPSDEAESGSITRALGQSVGLRVSGPLPDNSGRIETTYWLAPGQTRAKIESKVLNTKKPVTIADAVDWGAGGVVTDRMGTSPLTGKGSEFNVQWFAAKAGDVAVGVSTFPASMNGMFLGRNTRVAGYQEVGTSRVPFETRWLYFGTKNFSSVTDQIFLHSTPEQPYGFFRGKLLSDQTKTPAPDNYVKVLYYDKPTSGTKLDLRLFTQIQTDENGDFSAILPTLTVNAETGQPEGRYALETGSRSRNFGKSVMGIVVRPGHDTVRDTWVSEPGVLDIKVVDSRTKQPIPVRVQLEAIPPTPNFQFDDIHTPDGFVDSVYVPAEGRKIELFQGRWDLTITGGLRYDYVQKDIDIAFGSETKLEIELPMTAPTPGWVGLEIGAMTNATTGSVLSPEDVILMCAAEGIDWVISGDWETVTDFQPTIQKLNLQDRVGTSRGFRTHLPTHPEWGPFLIYPIAADAPDPKVAKAEWENLDSAEAFVSTLRRLYPGALIHSVNPFSPTDGYFFQKGRNIYELAYEPRDDIDLTIDAINVFEPRKVWDFKEQKNFYFRTTLTDQDYVPAPVSSMRLPFASEPGYPRLLVYTGESDVRKINEADLFAAMKADRWQITTGPFIEYTVEGKMAGDMVSGGPEFDSHLKIVGANWVNTSTVDFCREGTMTDRTSSNIGADSNLRRDTSQKVSLVPHSKNNMDTMLNVMVLGTGNLEPAIPAHGGGGIGHFAISGPIIADTNSNNEWDPPSYRDIGK